MKYQRAQTENTKAQQADLEHVLNPTPWLYHPSPFQGHGPHMGFWATNTMTCVDDTQPTNRDWLCVPRVYLLAPQTRGKVKIRLNGSKYDSPGAIPQHCRNYDRNADMSEHDWEGDCGKHDDDTYRTPEYAEWLRLFDCSPVYVTIELSDEEATDGEA